MEPDEPDVTYRVVLNHEEQYSIWPADRELPVGWRDEGTTGPKQDCLDHIDRVWTDLRPLSLRRAMAEQAEQVAQATAGTGEPSAVPAAEPAGPEEESLVSRLSRGDHPVEVRLPPERSGPALREAIDRGYVYVRFTDTRGGTELGITLDRDATDRSGADFDQPAGQVTLVGDLTLDFQPVRCTARIDLATFTGQGRLATRQPDAG